MSEKPPAESSSKPTSAKPPCRREDAAEIVSNLRGAGHIAYFAGGCVRDLLLGHEPVDFDVATDAPPEKVRNLFRSTQAVGQAFGVILVRMGASVVEVATFRTDGKYEDGRRPSSVRFATAQEDAQRRDFTINGLFLDPASGEVIDYVKGQADLDARILRAIGEADARFAEDHLRLLRAVRFAARFELSVEEGTRTAIVRHAAELARISPERIAAELRLMLTATTRGRAWKMLNELKLAQVIFRFMPFGWGGAVNDRSLFLRMADGETMPFGTALASAALTAAMDSAAAPGDVRALLERDSVRAMARGLDKALRLSNEELDLMRGTMDGAATMLQDGVLSQAVYKRFLAQPWASDARRLMKGLAMMDQFAPLIAGREGVLAGLENTEYAPAPLLDGDDLVQADWRPGPMFKRVLAAVYDAQLEGAIGTKGEAMELAARIAAG